MFNNHYDNNCPQQFQYDLSQGLNGKIYTLAGGHIERVIFNIQVSRMIYWDIIWKSRGGRVVNRVPMEVPRPKAEGPKPEGHRPQRFRLRNFPRDFIHHPTPKALPYNVIL